MMQVEKVFLDTDLRFAGTFFRVQKICLIWLLGLQIIRIFNMKVHNVQNLNNFRCLNHIKTVNPLQIMAVETNSYNHQFAIRCLFLVFLCDCLLVLKQVDLTQNKLISHLRLSLAIRIGRQMVSCFITVSEIWLNHINIVQMNQISKLFIINLHFTLIVACISWIFKVRETFNVLGL